MIPMIVSFWVNLAPVPTTPAAWPVLERGAKLSLPSSSAIGTRAVVRVATPSIWGER